MSTTTSAQINSAYSDCFEQHGYAVLRGFLNAEEVLRLRHHLERFLHEVVPERRAVEVYYEDKSRPETCKQIQHLERHDGCFAGLMFNSRFEALAMELLGEPVHGKNIQYFNKSPGKNLSTPPHQDGQYFMLSPCRALTMWLAVDAADEETGCLHMQPGSHKHALRTHTRSDTLGFSQFIPDYPTERERPREVAIATEPGDLVVHHAKTIHRASANNSPNRNRQALGFIYYGASASEDSAVHQAYQHQLAADLGSQGKI